MNAPIIRVLAGLLLGACVGLAVIVLVLVAKPPFLVNTPRSEHPALLVAIIAVPAVIGALLGLGWRRAERPR